jgi:beta-1,4-mannosyl-glycoprotein beta-1,4-N-acetylglucosaminyltransferase
MIYDCFLFFNELDILEIRLNLLNDVVDRFVIVESRQSFQGKLKPLFYYENRKRFERFEHKIIHLLKENEVDNNRLTAWQRESAQRNELLKVWNSCKPDDKIILSDVDEIPNPEDIRQRVNESQIIIFQLRNFYYYLNCRCISLAETWWHGPIMFSVKDLDKPQHIRMIVAELNQAPKSGLKRVFSDAIKWLNSFWMKKEIVYDSGWHFGFLGGDKMIIEKIEAFSHIEYNKDEYKNSVQISSFINSGKDIFGRDLNLQFVPIDKTYPTYILENMHKYLHLIKKIN